MPVKVGLSTDLPPMDDLKIGPGGQTFGELKQAVVTARAIYTADPSPLTVGVLEEAASLLHAAYNRVGLPYVSP